MAIVTSISTKLLENFVDFIAKKIEEYFIPRNQEHVVYLGLTAASVLLLLFVVVNFFGWKLGGDSVNSILKKIGEYCVPQIIREQVGYLTDYDSNMRTLKVEVEKLNGIQNKRQHSVDEAKKNGPGVDSWLTELIRINEEVKRILDDEARVNKRWLCGLCPDLISRYKLSWEAKKKTQDVIKLQKIADFESRIRIVDEIMEALKDDNIDAIGICGLGGMGKTTTVKKIDERAKAEKLFDVTVMAVVSQTLDLTKIQNEIAGKLGLKWDEQGVPRSRADQLREEMKKHKRILVILDDVWERLDLEAVGIPFGGENQGCKVMLTSRSKDVWKQMKRHKNFKIDALSEPEAWDLFKENAGNSIESPGLRSVAKEVVTECGGLPLAIVTVGRALANEAAKYIWNDALRKLRMPNPENVPDLLVDVYGKLELSYDFLKDQEKKSLLLLCCIFKEDTDIPIRDLVRYGMGLLMFRRINALADATDRVRTLVDKLKRCNLLLDNGEEDCVRMHDVVRDVIRFKATKGKEAFMLRYGPELKEWPTEGTDEQYASVSLISNEIHDHPKQLARPKPDLLLLEDNLEFEGMEELKVLQITEMSIPSPPTSLSYLTNLRALCLHDCRLKSISTIGELQTLVILSFRGSSITELPREFGKLTHLQLLDLTDCSSLKIVSPGVIKSLIRLEELYLKDSGLKWAVEERKAQNEVTLAELGSLSKLRALVSHLPTTKFSGGINLFDKLVRFQLISNDEYGDFEILADSEFQNFLRLQDVDATILADDGTRVLLKKTNRLEIRGVRGMEHDHDIATHHLFNEKVKSLCELRYMDVYGCEKLLNVFSSNLVQSLQNLEELEVSYCHLLEVVFDFEGVNIEEGRAALVLPCLKKLELRFLPRLTHLWKKAPQEIQGFQNLQSLVVFDCWKLKYIFTPSIAKLLMKLKNLQIGDCAIVEFVGKDQEGSKENKEPTKIIVFPMVRHLNLHNLPDLKSFGPEPYTFQWPILKVLSLKKTNVKVFTPAILGAQKQRTIIVRSHKEVQEQQITLPSLEVLEIEDEDNVERILTSLLPADSLCKLRQIRVFQCNKPSIAVPSNLLSALQNLEELSIKECDSLVEVFEVEGLKVEEGDRVLLPNLKKLIFEDLPELKHIVKREPKGFLFFQRLKVLQVRRCKNLRNLFSPSMVKSVNQLQELEISRCEMTTKIVAEDEGEGDEKAMDKIEFCQPKLKELTLTLEDLPELKHIVQREPKGILIFQRLTILQVRRCINLRNLFSTSMLKSVEQLQELEISRCEWMTKIVAEDEGEGDEKAMDKIEFPQLRCLTLQQLPILMSFFPKENTKASNPKAIDVDFGEILPGFNLHTHIQHLFNEKVAFPSLEELELKNLPNINEIWCKMDHEGTIGFQNLKSLSVSNCGNLRNVFYPSMVRGLVHLQYLNIHNCDMMKEIVVKEENEEEDRMDKILIPQLKKLRLSNLPRLTSFCQGLYPFDLPSLMHVSINQCPKMKTFSLNSPLTPKLQKVDNRFKSFWMGDLNKTIQQLFARKFTFPGDTELRLSRNNDVELILHSLQPDESLCKLRFLHVRECNKLLHVVPSNFLQNFGKLEVLIVQRCASLVVVFEVEGLNVKERDTVLFSKLENLHLKDLTKLKHLFNEKVLLSSLKKLILFQGLKSVRVERCGSLRNLFFPLMARGLVRLEELVIEHCDMMEEIISKEEEEEEERMNTIMVIPQLKRLELYHLPNLVSFCQGHHAFDLPSLVDVIVFDCPKMKTFSSGFVSTKRLNQVHNHDKRLWMRSDIRKSYWMGDLNNTIQQLFQRKFTFPGTKKLRLLDNDDVELILHSLQPDGSLCKLREMHVEKCNKLLHVIPSNFLQSFGNLEELTIRSCASLVEVFEVEGLNVEKRDTVVLSKLEKLHLKDLTELKHLFNEKVLCPSLEKLILFQGLKSMRVECCNKLLHVVPSNLLQSLGNLEELTVLSCTSLVEVFEVEGLNVEERDTVLLPKLKKLHLKDLTELKRLFNEKVLFPSLEKSILFQGLKSVRVGCCNKLLHVVPSNLLQSLGNLEELTVLSCTSLVEVFEVEGLNVEERDTVLLSKLEYLYLKDLTELKHLFNEKVLFPSLEKLILFQGLKSVRVERCGSLRNLFYPLMARGLVRLEELVIEHCDMMEEIISKGEEEEEERMNTITVIPQLKRLELYHLPNLVSFCQGRYAFDLPSLVDVFVFDCPKMKTFSSEFVSTKGLKQVHNCKWLPPWMGSDIRQSSWMGDLNNTIQQLFQRKELEVNKEIGQ